MDQSIPINLDFAANSVGKQVGDNLYLHVSALPSIPTEWHEVVIAAQRLANIEPEQDFNVVKFHKLRDELSLLSYTNFFDDSFPALARSWRISLSRRLVTFRTYEESRNPPILHRKELLLPPSDVRIARYAAVTEAAEDIGLFTDPNRIGFSEHWYALIAERGYEFVDGQFLPVANCVHVQDSRDEELFGIRRHLTALARTNFSAPVQALSRHGLLNSGTTFFDYGCGRGDDIRALVANGINASGWDPHYAPDAPKHVADTVNIGFVINVIENLTERVEALKGAFAHTRGVLAVAAMLSSQTPPEGRPYGDGYLSSRNTFQKYFTQAQLRDFIEHTLDESAIAAAPGVFFVFRDKALEQRFLSERYGHKSAPVLSRPWNYHRPRLEARRKRDRAAELLEAHRQIFDSIWLRILELGRTPVSGELLSGVLTEVDAKIGSYAKALKIVLDRYDARELEHARISRMSDLLVLFGLQQFQKRKPYRNLDQRLQRDVRYFFGDYAAAQASARKVLFNLGNLEAIDAACRESCEKGYGWLEEGHSLQLHVSLLERLPTLLRIYVGCATVLYGDISGFDLLKIHIRSGKITLMRFDDFENLPLPRLQQRVKVNLRDQEIDVFSYGSEYPPPLLYRKSRFINEEYPHYSEQAAFDEQLESLQLLDLSGYGPSESDFVKSIERARWQVDGFGLLRSQRIPQLDEPCGAYLTYRRLIECGETQARTGISNLPSDADSYNALYELATNILDPVIDYFGMIKLTYGFCSRELAKHIRNGIAPELDQHAGHEKKRSGRYVCERLGAACDFIVEDEDMEQVATWVLEHTPSDRIYVYGKSRPIHVSYSRQPSGQLVEMKQTASGKRVPRVLCTRDSL